MKKTILLIVITFISSLTFSQEEIKNHKRIYFEYKIRSTIEYKDNGLYIDSLILKQNFPELAYQKVKINDKSFGFVKIENIPKKTKSYIISKIFHTNINVIYKFNIKTKEYTKEYYYDCDEETKNLYKALNYNCSEDNDIRKNAPKSEFYGDEKLQITEWIGSNYGFYIESIGDMLFKKLVEFDKSLPKFITPSVYFDNNQYGIKKIYSTYHTTELINYRYE